MLLMFHISTNSQGNILICILSSNYGDENMHVNNGKAICNALICNNVRNEVFTR